MIKVSYDNMNRLVISDFSVILQTAKSFIPRLSFVSRLHTMSTNQFHRLKQHAYCMQPEPDLIVFDLDSAHYLPGVQLGKLTSFMEDVGESFGTRVILISTQQQLNLLTLVEH